MLGYLVVAAVAMALGWIARAGIERDQRRARAYGEWYSSN